MHTLKKGFLITLEGIDGSGKSTLAQLIFEHFHTRYPTLLTKEPGATALGKNLRVLLQTKAHELTRKAEFLLFAADRAEHIHKIIKPALERNTFIISDRMHDSSVAYQGYGRGLDTTMIMAINHWVMETVQPDITLFLKIDPHLAYTRMYERGKLSSFDQEQSSFFERINKGFEEIFKQRTNVYTLDASLSPTALIQSIIPVLEEKLQSLTYETATFTRSTPDLGR